MRFDTFIQKIRLSFHKERESYLFWFQLLGFFPRDLKHYHQALLHKSLHERTANGEELNNERLEFLGDAILQSIVTTYLYHRYSDHSEGFLSVARSQIVCREALNKLGGELGLHKMIHKERHVSTRNTYLLGNAFEALIGAIYLDRGYHACQRFVETHILEGIDINALFRESTNYKSQLLEWAQGHHIATSFEAIDQQRDRSKRQVFISQVFLNGIPCATGSGYTKKESHQKAAQRTLEQVHHNKDLQRTIFAGEQSIQSQSTEQQMQHPQAIEHPQPVEHS